MEEQIKISKKEYKEYQKLKKTDQKLLADIRNGIKDVVAGRITKVL